MFLYTDFAKSFQIFFQDPATPVMEGIIHLHNDIFLVLTFILISVCYFFFYVVNFFYFYLNSIKNHTKKNFYINYLKNLLLANKLTHNSDIELIWTIVPCFFLIFIAALSFHLLYAMDEAVYSPVTIKVIGHQWYWSYEYSFLTSKIFEGKLESVKDITFDSYMQPYSELNFGDLRLLEVDYPLVLPIWVNIRFLITSDDVLHSWAVPSLGIKCDAVPGRLNQIFSFIKRPGKFYGQCSEICGVNHGFMPIVVVALSPEDYLEWGELLLLELNLLNEVY